MPTSLIKPGDIESTFGPRNSKKIERRILNPKTGRSMSQSELYKFYAEEFPDRAKELGSDGVFNEYLSTGNYFEAPPNIPRFDENFFSSAAQFGSDMINAFANPVETATGLKKLVNGTYQLLVPGEHPDEETAKALGRFYRERYGSPEAVAETISTDPVGFMADLSVFLDGGAALVKGAGAISKSSKLAKTAKVLKYASEMSDPLVGPIRTVTGSVHSPLGTEPTTRQKIGRHLYQKALKPGVDAYQKLDNILDTGIEASVPTKVREIPTKGPEYKFEQVGSKKRKGVPVTDAGAKAIEAEINNFTKLTKSRAEELAAAGERIAPGDVVASAQLYLEKLYEYAAGKGKSLSKAQKVMEEYLVDHGGFSWQTPPPTPSNPRPAPQLTYSGKLWTPVDVLNLRKSINQLTEGITHIDQKAKNNIAAQAALGRALNESLYATDIAGDIHKWGTQQHKLIELRSHLKPMALKGQQAAAIQQPFTYGSAAKLVKGEFTGTAIAAASKIGLDLLPSGPMSKLGLKLSRPHGSPIIRQAATTATMADRAIDRGNQIQYPEPATFEQPPRPPVAPTASEIRQEAVRKVLNPWASK